MSAFVQAAHYYPGRVRPLRVFVWHDMEVVNGATTAENVARNFADPNGRESSAHVCVDLDSEVECVKITDTAWHAPGANADGCGVELAGYARFTAAEWATPETEATLQRAALWVAPRMKAYSVPPRWLSDAELAGMTVKGMTTHAQVSRVFKLSTHTDPGPNFPAGHVLDLVVNAYGLAVPTAPTGPIPPKPTGTNPAGVRALQTAIHLVLVDGRWGDGTDTVAAMVRLAAIGHLPGDIKALQRAIGAKPDGAFGRLSKGSLVATVVAIQKIIGVAADGSWGPITDGAWIRFRAANYKRY